jgi:hypothetical protein
MTAQTSAPPDLLIRRIEQDRALVLSGPRLGTERVTFPLADALAVREFHSRFVENLGRFRDLIGDGLSCPPSRAAEGLAELAAAGRVFLMSVLESPDEVYRLAECFRRACPTWTGGTRLRPPQIQSYGRMDEHLPWELLPVFDPRHMPSANSLVELEEACRPFGGFAATVERRIPVAVPKRTAIDASGGIGVRFFYHAGFDGAQAELGFLRAHADRIRLRGPYPNGDANAPSVARQLRDPTLGDEGLPTGLADHMVHFACHCDTRGPIVEEHAFHLADEDGELTLMSVRRLLEELLLADHPENRTVDKPVVFVNACDSATLDARCGTGLLTPFVKNGNIAMIGTVATVPDEAAASFSERFYGNLLTGQALGNALFLSRHNLLLQHGNPLGILYCLFGVSELRMLPVGRFDSTVSGG